MYSQDLSNYKTENGRDGVGIPFLYSQDLSYYKTNWHLFNLFPLFLYSQDLSNYKTKTARMYIHKGFCILKI